jgi:hypothetical protein
MHRQPDQAEHGSAPLGAGPGAAANDQPPRASLTAPAVPASLLEAAMERVASDPPVPGPDSRIASIRHHLDELRQRAAGAESWLETSGHYTRLLNATGVVPVTARFDVRDLAFLGRAREDLLNFADLGLRLADLHRPLDAGGTTSDPANPALRCRSCMWRWPCPTFRLMTEILIDRGAETGPPVASRPGMSPPGGRRTADPW